MISSSEDEEEVETENGSEDSENEEDEWDIKCILDESDSQYLIDWEGPWSPTWVRKRLCSSFLWCVLHSLTYVSGD